MPYQVTCALVQPKDKDGRIHAHYYGSVIGWLNDKERANYLRNNLVREVEAAEPKPEPTLEVASEATSEPGKKPLKTASFEAWVQYAVSKGFDREEAVGGTKQALIDALG
jgi:hypothetical protein